jgi:uncharacterized protein
MGIITDDMRWVVEDQQLGFAATVTPDGKPNLSPKGTTRVWDEDHLVFADICSPNTVANLRTNPAIEINVVDPIVRKGYRFKGIASVLSGGPLYERIEQAYRARGSSNPFKHIVLIKVEHAEALISPAYDLGRTEDEVAEHWEKKRDEMRERRKVR